MNNIVVAIICLFISASCFNKDQDGSVKLSEKELYNFGLEPEQSVYDFFKLNISPTDLNTVCEETKDFRVITIAIEVIDSVVTKCEVRSYSFVSETGKITKKDSSMTEQKFKNALLNKTVRFHFIDNNRKKANYDFRLNLNKYCP
jgi:hypothetical protein